MIIYKTVKCETPDCSNTLRIRKDSPPKSIYCKECKAKNTLHILRLQTTYNVKMPALLIEISKTFNFEAGDVIADVLKVTKRVFVSWLFEYFGIKSWMEFKKLYQCGSKTCYIFSVPEKVNKYYFLTKIKKDLGLCACHYTLSPYEKYSKRERVLSNQARYIMVKIDNLSQFKYFQKFYLEFIDENTSDI